LVRFEDVAARYGQGADVLSDLSFELAPGSFNFLTGPSGAGKSTILRLLYLALKPARGRVVLFDRDVVRISRRDLPGIRRRIGVVFQDFRLIDHLSALDNVALPLRVAGAGEAQVRDHVAELLSWVGLADHIHHLPPTLSGGQQQRVAIARAVISRPSLLLADEPTGNVDDRIALRLMYLFEELNKMGTTVVIATHNDSLVARFPHPQLHLEGGKLFRVPGRTRPAGPRANA
jgi:cell division transport system ATP-binding protein